MERPNQQDSKNKKDAAGRTEKPNEVLAGTLPTSNSLIPQVAAFPERWKQLAKLVTPQSVLSLPKEIDEVVKKVMQGGSVQLVSGILKDEGLKKELLDTKMWSDERQLSDTLNQVAFGQPDNDTIKDVRRLVETLSSGDKESHIREVIADILLTRRIDEEGFMKISNEVLQSIHPLLAENLRDLLSKDRDLQYKSFHWLFKYMTICLETAAAEEQPSQRELLKARIIFKQFCKVLQDSDNEKWLGLQTHVVMSFAQRLASELKNEIRPFSLFFLSLQPELARDFFIAVDKNFAKLGDRFNTEKPKQVKDEAANVLRHYGGETVCAQGFETLLSVAVCHSPSVMYNYFWQRYDAVEPHQKAIYLAAMKYAAYSSNENKEWSPIEKHISFLVDEVLHLCDNLNPTIQTRLHSVLRHVFGDIAIGDTIAERMFTRLEFDYSSLHEAKRTFLVEFVLYSSLQELVPDGLKRAIPLIDFEMAAEFNKAIQSKILWTEFFGEEVLSQLDASQAKNLRNAILEGYDTFSINDILADKLVDLMAYYRTASLEETFNYFARLARTDKEKSKTILEFLGKQAVRLPLDLNEAEQQSFDRITKTLSLQARTISLNKMTQISIYYSIVARVIAAHEEVSAFVARFTEVTMTAQKINSTVAELDRQKSQLEKEQQQKFRLRRELEDAKDACKEDLARMREDLKVVRSNTPIWKRLLPKWRGFFSEEDALIQSIESVRNIRLDLADQKKQYNACQTRLRQIEIELKVLKKKHDAAKLEQAKMTEALSQIQTQKENLEKYLKKGEERMELQKKAAQQSLKTVSDFYQYIRPFFSSPAMSEPLRREVLGILDCVLESKIEPSKDPLSVAPDKTPAEVKIRSEATALLSRLELANSPKEQGSLITLLLSHLQNDQLHRGIYKDDVSSETRYLVELTKSGHLTPKDTTDPVFLLMNNSLRKNRFMFNSMEELYKVNDELAGAYKKNEKEISALIKEIINVLGAGTTSLEQPIKDFLRLKFGEPDEAGEKPAIQLLSDVFQFLVALCGPEKGIEVFFLVISGEEGQFFVKPGEYSTAPKNRAEQIDIRFKRYVDAQKALRNSVGTLKTKAIQLQDGKAWEVEANDNAISYFMHLIEAQGLPEKVRYEAQLVVTLLILEPWCKEIDLLALKRDEQERLETEEYLKICLGEKINAPKRGKKDLEKLACSEYLIIDTLTRYAAIAPNISRDEFKNAQSSPKKGAFSVMQVVQIAELLSRRALSALGTIHPQNHIHLLKALENFEKLLDPRITIESETDKISVHTQVMDAIGKIKEGLQNEPLHTSFGTRRLPVKAEQYALPPSRHRNKSEEATHLELD